MRTYRKSIVILLSIIAVALAATVIYTLVSGLGNRGITVSYGPPAEEDQVDYPININTATAEELTRIEGIGETKAADILKYRESVGGFSSVEELLNVPGIGEKTLESIREYICV